MRTIRAYTIVTLHRALCFFGFCWGPGFRTSDEVEVLRECMFCGRWEDES